MTNEQKIEALLFWKGEPMSIEKISTTLNLNKDEVLSSLTNLEKGLVGRGITLVKKDEEVMLGTIKDASEMIEAITKEELSRDLGKAALETLAIVLYEGPVSRATIDYIRGVNSSFILRNLSIRGLVEKINNPNDARSYLYRPSFDLLTFLGLESVENLPDFETIKTKINSFMSSGEDKPKE